MIFHEALKRLQLAAKQGIFVFSKQDMEKLFPFENGKTLEKTLQRLVTLGFLLRPVRGFYVNPYASDLMPLVLETLACTMRRGHFTYLSLESALSEYGLMSQIPVSRLTVMTQGSPGLYHTPFGTIEFTHTRRERLALWGQTQRLDGRPLRLALQATALRDLRRVGRNMDLLTFEESEPIEEKMS